MIDEKYTEETLLIFLKSHPELSLYPDFPPKTFRFGEDTFHQVKTDRWQGFYDWLRDETENIIGLRYWLFEKIDPRLPLLTSLPYINSDQEEGFIEIYFFDSRSYVQANSDDQDFGNQGIFLSDQGLIALAFDISTFTKAELDALKQSMQVG
ncbi:MAG: hypothetical protein ETSY1_24585 [Candidatus Entotheonella factor]|uniref:Uncharacterized protein n=1 Tax=Entotheonella factor TaxID=1429438 RepID=W4LGV4_ENTF1|nr:MAG: hypothetical protein ETSY1_24585 [Candidatus Entotheonella factor]